MRQVLDREQLITAACLLLTPTFIRMKSRDCTERLDAITRISVTGTAIQAVESL